MGIEKSRVPLGHGEKIRDATADMYGIGSTTVARLIRINELCDELKKLVDSGNIRIRPAVELSYIPKDAQHRLFERMLAIGSNCIELRTAKELRALYKEHEDFTEKQVEQVLTQIDKGTIFEKPHKITVSMDVFDRYLKNVQKNEVVSVVEKALEMYFKGVARQITAKER